MRRCAIGGGLVASGRGRDRLVHGGSRAVNAADLVQWPAMVASVVAAWLVASQSDRRRSWGFWIFLASNVLWIAWGWHAHAWALIALQVCLAGLNIRGVKKNQA